MSELQEDEAMDDEAVDNEERLLSFEFSRGRSPGSSNFTSILGMPSFTSILSAGPAPNLSRMLCSSMSGTTWRLYSSMNFWLSVLEGQAEMSNFTTTRVCSIRRNHASLW